MRWRLWVRDHGLILVCGGLFLLFWIGMAVFGVQVHNSEQAEHGGTGTSLIGYLATGDFAEATFENWESEFLQMGMYVVLTAILFQRGSAESKPLDGPAPQDADPREAPLKPDTPWAVRRGGWVLAVYEHSLSLLLLLLFVLSFVGHALGGAAAYSAEQVEHGEAPVTAWEYLGTSQFWFESLQNWQSEFLAVAAIVLGSVWLRERGSSESKPVAAPHAETGA